MTTMPEVKIFSKPKKVCKAVAREILKLTQESHQNRFDVALSGGSTPKKLFKILAAEFSEEIPWERLHFWWGDERCVPPDNENSNFKLANDFLFSKIQIPEENLHRVKGENKPEEEVFRYADEIEESLNYRGDAPVFDLVILGLGEDGHTASIFPDQIELFEDENICAASQHPITGQNRITLTGKVLNNASRVFFLVTGANKALRISEIMNDDEAAKLLPAYYISPKNGELIWYLDEEAASRIS
ncbi:6-phosphogluconolactonase [Maribellus comscasis]|uniref:6-phosphogluconolactonase n=1 Tax=Maribellus comscasis TaxID=2681766 RepID=A0A6I6JN80_9BACT|nr:6-phosphogluconolactonase [Maribellus comscasis]QGY42430.1 6-phosphogluconolactonase [Maribellus comscasis]